MEYKSGKAFLDISGLPEFKRIKSGLANFDKICDGGLAKEGIHLVCGAPKQGKSLVVESLALEYSQSQKVIYISCENGFVRDARRFNAMIESRLKSGIWMSFRNGFSDECQWLDNIHYYDLQSYSGVDGIKVLKEILEKEKDGIVILDATERLVDVGSQDQIHQLGRQFVDFLITQKTNFTFMISWQTVKGSANNKKSEFTSADLSGSCAISQACDSFWFVQDNMLKCGRSRDGYDTNLALEFSYPLGISSRSREVSSIK